MPIGYLRQTNFLASLKNHVTGYGLPSLRLYSSGAAASGGGSSSNGSSKLPKEMHPSLSSLAAFTALAAGVAGACLRDATGQHVELAQHLLRLLERVSGMYQREHAFFRAGDAGGQPSVSMDHQWAILAHYLVGLLCAYRANPKEPSVLSQDIRSSDLYLQAETAAAGVRYCLRCKSSNHWSDLCRKRTEPPHNPAGPSGGRPYKSQKFPSGRSGSSTSQRKEQSGSGKPAN